MHERAKRFFDEIFGPNLTPATVEELYDQVCDLLVKAKIRPHVALEPGHLALIAILGLRRNRTAEKK